MGKCCQEHVQRTHVQSQMGYDQGWEVGMTGVGGVDGKMETIILEQQ